MAKETNHRRKSKVERKVEELDVEALTKELVKANAFFAVFTVPDTTLHTALTPIAPMITVFLKMPMISTFCFY